MSILLRSLQRVRHKLPPALSARVAQTRALDQLQVPGPRHLARRSTAPDQAQAAAARHQQWSQTNSHPAEPDSKGRGQGLARVQEESRHAYPARPRDN